MTSDRGDRGGRAGAPGKEATAGKQTAAASGAARVASTPGKQTLAAALPHADPGADRAGAADPSEASNVHRAAAYGVSGGAPAQLPFLDRIQKSFGKHDVSNVQAHQDAAATDGARAMGAQAYTTGNQVAFATQPTLHLVAEEAAHVVQQRSGIQLDAGVGKPDDSHESHALAVADAVVAGQSAEPLLDAMTGRAAPDGNTSADASNPQVQMRSDAGPKAAPKDPWDALFKTSAHHVVNKVGGVDAENGLRLRTAPKLEAKDHGIIPFGTIVMVQRETNEGREEDRWAYVVCEKGAGFVQRAYVSCDMPERSAKLHLIKPGETLGGIAERAYGKHFHSGNDARLYVHALWIANQHRTGITLQDVNLSTMDTATRGKDEEETLRIWKGVRVLAGSALWIPSEHFVQSLKSHGLVTSGQTEIKKVWDKAKDAVEDFVDDVKYVSGLVAGLIHGAGSAIYDLFAGAVEMIGKVIDIAMKIVTGDIGGLIGVAKDWIGDFTKLWHDRHQIKEGFLAKWFDENAFSRGHFRGEVIGWAVMTILIMILTAGESTAGVAAVVASKFPMLVKAANFASKVGDGTTWAKGAAKGAHKLGDRAEDAVRARVNAYKARQKKHDKPDHDKHDKHDNDDKPKTHDKDDDKKDDADREQRIEWAHKIRRALKITKMKVQKAGSSAERFKLVRASGNFAKALAQHVDDNVQGVALTPHDSNSGGDRKVELLPHRIHDLIAEARRAGSEGAALAAFARGDRDAITVRGHIHAGTLQIELTTVYNGPH